MRRGDGVGDVVGAVGADGERIRRADDVGEIHFARSDSGVGSRRLLLCRVVLDESRADGAEALHAAERPRGFGDFRRVGGADAADSAEVSGVCGPEEKHLVVGRRRRGGEDVGAGRDGVDLRGVLMAEELVDETGGARRCRCRRRVFCGGAAFQEVAAGVSDGKGAGNAVEEEVVGR